jgi:hypothetical protein
MKRKEEIEHALSVLGRRMALDGASDMEVLCCGASALCVLGLLSRSTMDVDVPEEHRRILDERRSRIASGEATLLDWDQVS